MKVLTIAPNWNGTPFFREQVQSLQAKGIENELFQFSTRKSALNYIRSWIKLRRRYKWKDFDLVHIHYGQSALLTIPCPLPKVITFHGSDLNGIVGKKGHKMIGKALQYFSRWAARRVDQVIVVSEKMRLLVNSKAAQVEVVPCGIDTEKFRPMCRKLCREKLNLPDKKLILFAGDPQRLVKRFSLAKETVEKTDAELVVVYNVPHEQMPFYINACDAVLLTSSQEGSPQIVKESLACNVPVIATDVGDISERIVKGCYLGHDAESLAEAIKTAVGGRIDGSSVKELSLAKIAEKIIEIYKPLVKN